MNTLKLTGILLIILIGFNSCSDDDSPEKSKGNYEKGYFITNEGPFQSGSGTITFISDEGIASQNIYKNVNNEDLGNVVQSMSLNKNNTYIIVNNSNKIVVANRYTMEKITEISGNGIQNPRYLVSKNGVGYVSDWGDPFNPNDDFIAVIDLNSNEVTNTISVGEGPEKMTIKNDKLFINLKGGFGHNNKVAVLNLNNNELENIEVGYVPNSIESDKQGNVWVLCEGKPSWTNDETNGQLYKINTNNLNTTFYSFDLTDHPKLLNIEDNSIYYNLNGKVYEMNVNSNELPQNALNGLDGFYYTMKVEDGELFGTDAADFNSEGSLKVFNIISGNLVQTFQTGIIPGEIIFQ